MDLAPLVFSSGWASGVNSYATVLVLGLFARFSDTTTVPDVLGRTDVLLVAGLMFVIEFVADKVPYVDSAWDAVSTFIRPVVGAALGAVLAGDATGVDQALLAALGGSTALASHGVKSGLRLAVNTSPEPVTNSVVSVGEDLSVIGVMALAVAHPWVALGVSATLLILGVILVVWLLGKVRRGLTAMRRRRSRTP
ncbi:MAG: DUF4126 domain-containing protein [Actinomycetota bacterium]|nr:DUF4126 domain-containing protein [Actinomycetota bacterium]